MPPTERPIRAVFFDAGNTLLRMNYAVIAAELVGHGVRVAPEEVQRAEWRARVRLDDQVLARSRPGDSTESRASADRYLRYVLEELGVADAATIDKVAEWRRTYNRPVGVWNTADPQAPDALALVRQAGLRADVSSHSHGSVRSTLNSLELAHHLDSVVQSAAVGGREPG